VDAVELSAGAGSFGRVSGPGDVPSEIIDRLRPVCLRLPQAYEEPAWVGIRWRIRLAPKKLAAQVDRPLGGAGLG
jgi:hypothetical protein